MRFSYGWQTLWPHQSMYIRFDGEQWQVHGNADHDLPRPLHGPMPGGDLFLSTLWLKNRKK